MRIHRAIKCAVTFGVALAPGLVSMAQPVESPFMSSSDGYMLGVNDQLQVTIFGQGQNQTFTTRIKEDGTVTVPFLGAVLAANRTARQLADYITNELRVAGIYNDPIVGVEVVEFVSNSVTVLGEIANPGVYPLDREQTVAMMLARSGGARNGGADYVILRRSGSETGHEIELSQLSGEWSTATPLLPGDTLFVPVAPTVYIYGQVNGPGAFAVRSDLTVRQALARAGGPTLAGSEDKVTLHRDGKRVKRVELDELVRDGDVLFVNERLF